MVPHSRSSAALREPPTLVWTTSKAVMTAHQPCGNPKSFTTAKAATTAVTTRKAWRSSAICRRVKVSGFCSFTVSAREYLYETTGPMLKGADRGSKEAAYQTRHGRIKAEG